MKSIARDSGLTITRRELLETSIAQLQTLASFLRDQLSESVEGSPPLETRACKEILRAVSTVIQTHRSYVPGRVRARIHSGRNHGS
jgi:hypothetical protein